MGKLTHATVTLVMEMDLAPALAQLVDAARAAAGEPPLEADKRAAVMQRALGVMGQKAVGAIEARRAAFAQAQPDGVTPGNLEAQLHGTMVTSTTTFELADLALLPQVVTLGDGGEATRPLETFKVTRKPGQLVVSGASPALGAPKGARGQLSFTLETTAAVKQHNASSVDGNRLTWSAALDAAPFQVNATYARS